MKNLKTSVFLNWLSDEKEDEAKTHYKQRFMKKDMNSELYLDAVKKSVPLNQLFKVVRDCY